MPQLVNDPLSSYWSEGEPRWCAPDGTGRTEPGEIHIANTVDGVQVGCFPDLYESLSGNPPDKVITL